METIDHHWLSITKSPQRQVPPILFLHGLPLLALVLGEVYWNLETGKVIIEVNWWQIEKGDLIAVSKNGCYLRNASEVEAVALM